MDITFDVSSRQIVIDRELCGKCSIANDNWGRQGVSPFAVACYMYHAMHTLGKTADEVYHAVMTRWDSLYWGNSPISISLWNKLFNNAALTEAEWSRIMFPLQHINIINTSVTSSSRKHECYPMFFGTNRGSTEFLVCTKEAYDKAIRTKTSAKVTAYRYGLASGMMDIIQGLREETEKVILPFT